MSFYFRSCLLLAISVGPIRAAPAQTFGLRPIQTSPTPVIGVPRSLAIGAADRIFSTEEKPAQILSYDSTGRFVRSIGREGAGPGELRSAVVGAASFVVTYDGQLSRLTAFDLDGKLLWTKPGPCCRSAPIRIDRQGRFYVLAVPVFIGPSRPTETVNVYNSKGDLIDSLTVPGSQPDAQGLWQVVGPQAAAAIPIPFAPKSYYAVTRSGGLIWGTSSSLSLFGGGRLSTPSVRVVLHPYTTELTIEVRQAAREALLSQYGRFFDPPTLEKALRLTDIPTTAPTFFGLDVDSCDRWWVLRTPPYSPEPTRFDVLSPTGAPVATAIIPHRLIEPGFLWAIGTGRLAAIVDDGGEPRLVLYHLPATLACRG
jgi:hypothetical protein